MLIEEGADVNAMSITTMYGCALGRDCISFGGYTALMAASEMGYIDIVKLLIKEGADVNVQDDDGITALRRAYKFGHTEIIELLMAAGAEYY